LPVRLAKRAESFCTQGFLSRGIWRPGGRGRGRERERGKEGGREGGRV